MNNPSNSSGGSRLATLWMCLVVAFVIAAASLAVLQYVEAVQEKEIHPQQQEKLNENSESPAVSPTVGTGNSGALVPVVADRQHWPDVSSTGINSQFDHDYCVLIGVTEPNTLGQEIAAGNALKIPIQMCESIGNNLVYLILEGYISGEDLQYPEYSNQ